MVRAVLTAAFSSNRLPCRLAESARELRDVPQRDDPDSDHE